ncbi:uncharacterized protein [Lepidochelys kempii]|uniref:uncharacterized protein n=1 Tax=Lepidochelys kempii TaxID=8472 RepID=UPI003C6EC28C
MLCSSIAPPGRRLLLSLPPGAGSFYRCPWAPAPSIAPHGRWVLLSLPPGAGSFYRSPRAPAPSIAPPGRGSFYRSPGRRLLLSLPPGAGSFYRSPRAPAPSIAPPGRWVLLLLPPGAGSFYRCPRAPARSIAAPGRRLVLSLCPAPVLVYWSVKVLACSIALSGNQLILLLHPGAVPVCRSVQASFCPSVQALCPSVTRPGLLLSLFLGPGSLYRFIWVLSPPSSLSILLLQQSAPFFYHSIWAASHSIAPLRHQLSLPLHRCLPHCSLLESPSLFLCLDPTCSVALSLSSHSSLPEILLLGVSCSIALAGRWLILLLPRCLPRSSLPEFPRLRLRLDSASFYLSVVAFLFLFSGESQFITGSQALVCSLSPSLVFQVLPFLRV